MANRKHPRSIAKLMKAKRMDAIEWTWERIAEWIDELAQTDPDVTINAKAAARSFLCDATRPEVEGFVYPRNVYVTKFDEIRFVWDCNDGSVCTFTRDGQEVWADLESFRVKAKRKI